MITLNPPITITIPSTNEDGTKGSFDVTFNSLDYKVVYDNTAKVCRAIIKNLNIGITLWKGADYVSAGTWTDADTDARLTEVLGADPQATIQNLIPKHPSVS